MRAFDARTSVWWRIDPAAVLTELRSSWDARILRPCSIFIQNIHKWMRASDAPLIQASGINCPNVYWVSFYPSPKSALRVNSKLQAFLGQRWKYLKTKLAKTFPLNFYCGRSLVIQFNSDAAFCLSFLLWSPKSHAKKERAFTLQTHLIFLIVPFQHRN